MWELERSSCRRSSAWRRFSLNPAAGAHAELTALLIAKAYFAKTGESAQRTTVIVPDTAHGTNPASAAMVGYKVVSLKRDERGRVGVDDDPSGVGSGYRGLHDDQPEHARAVRRSHPRDRARGARRRRPDVLRRRQRQRADGQRAARATWASISCISTCTRRFRFRTAAAAPAPARSALRQRLVEFLPVAGRRHARRATARRVRSARLRSARFDRHDALVLVEFRAHGSRARLHLRQRRRGLDARLAARRAQRQLRPRAGSREFSTTPYDETCRHEFVASAQATQARDGRARARHRQGVARPRLPRARRSTSRCSSPNA